MVYGFVKQSGGDVKIYSEPGEGTAITLLLPTAQGAAAQRASAPARPHRARAGATALVVDDEADLLEVASVHLQELGYRVLRADDAAQALALAEREGRIELLLTDVMMPGGMNGVELARRLRDARPEIAVVYCSGFPSQALAARGSMRVDGPLLNKPYVRADLERVLNEAIDERMAA
jgi:CheY-like chemotaxis protein